MNIMQFDLLDGHGLIRVVVASPVDAERIVKFVTDSAFAIQALEDMGKVRIIEPYTHENAQNGIKLAVKMAINAIDSIEGTPIEYRLGVKLSSAKRYLDEVRKEMNHDG